METTLFPLAQLPSCATLCGHLYDANGACVPPATTVADPTACFCSQANLAPFSTGTAGVCDSACTGDAGGLASIQNWYTGFCGAAKNAGDTTSTSTGTSTGTSSGASSTRTSSSGSKNTGGGTWMSTHWQWVIFIVVVVVGIAGIWIGACIWRRKYLRKKDRQYALSKSLAQRTSTGGGSAIGMDQSGVHMPHAGMFQPAGISEANIFDTEKGRGKRT